MREIEDDLADLRQYGEGSFLALYEDYLTPNSFGRLLASLCDDFANTDPAKGKRLQRLQERIEVCMDTIRINVSLILPLLSASI